MPKDNVENEVQKLLSKKIDKDRLAHELETLRGKLGDDELVDEIQEAYLEKYNKTLKRAKKFAELIRNKYANTTYPLHVLLLKGQKYKAKYGLTNEEYNLFQNMADGLITGTKSEDVLQHKTNMSKVLGDIRPYSSKGTMKLNDSDYKHMQEIIRLNATSKALHAQVLLQSIQYKSCDFEAMNAKYRREQSFGPGEHIHPVVVALFLPKIEVLENTFLRSNISSVVKARFNNEQLMSRYDYELFNALVRDPNDIVCDNRSSVLDLLNRFHIQNQLWNCVLGLRNGQCYNTNYRNFITSMDTCKYNKFDNPDLIYGRYDGTIIKRLFASFSFRPTIVASLASMPNNFSLNPYQQVIKPDVKSIPMINFRLPSVVGPNAPTIDLKDALNQKQILLNNGVFGAHETSIVHSNGVLVFCVDRRTNIIKTAVSTFSLNTNPIAVAGFERINTKPINFDKRITIRNDTYRLRSVVVAETNKIAKVDDIVIGSSAIVVRYSGECLGGVNLYADEFVKYDPYSVINPDVDASGKPVQNDQPFQGIKEIAGIDSEEENFTELAQTKGVIFVYELCEENTNDELVIN